MQKNYFHNRIFRAMINSNLFDELGTYLYMMVFIIYASKISHYRSLAVSLASLAIIIPNIASLISGYLADHVNNFFKTMIQIRITQTILFLIITFGMSFKPSFTIFIVVWILGIISDFLGSYNSLINVHVLKLIIQPTEMNDAMALNQGLLNLSSIVGQASGVTLIALLNYHFEWVAFINVISFIMALVILLSVRNDLKRLTVHQQNHNQENGFIKQIKQSAKNIPHNLLIMTFIFAGFNFLSSSMLPMVNVTYLKAPVLWFHNYGTTIATLNIVSTVGTLLGIFLINDWFRKLNMKQFIILISVLMMIFGSLFLMASSITKFLIVVTLLITSYFSGKISPKLSSLIVNHVNRKQLGTVVGFMNTLMLLSTPIGNAIFLTLLNHFGNSIAWLAFISCSFVLLIFTSIKRLS
ncbi:MFS transporter [Philodulcilactobacillus myokoensis]|uniref:MFS transporter n=1 Tax=Philodulcilactobacillus myokoensis TaxID=2929573 RepID=UPI002570BCA8|nr:MFS transporter [Philodulcilactobacillus myokoensis]